MKKMNGNGIKIGKQQAWVWIDCQSKKKNQEIVIALEMVSDKRPLSCFSLVFFLGFRK